MTTAGRTCRATRARVVRPRFFWDAGDGRTFFATVGTTIENREGGTMPGRVLAATGAPYTEALDTRRVDGGAAGQMLLRGRYVLTARAAFAQQRHRHQFGEAIEHDRHDTVFSEVAIRGTAPRHTWVPGAAIEYDGYTQPRPAAVRSRLHDSRRVRAGRRGGDAVAGAHRQRARSIITTSTARS